MLVISAIRDISERKRTGICGTPGGDRLLSAVEASHPAYCRLYDNRERLVLCNGAFRQLFDRGELEGQPADLRRILQRRIDTELFELGEETREAFLASVAWLPPGQVGALSSGPATSRGARDQPACPRGGVVSTILGRDRGR